MANRTFWGTAAGKAARTRRIYEGDANGRAKKIKRGYIGVNGVAQCFFANGVLAFEGTCDPVADSDVIGASAGNYAVFANTETLTIDAYSALQVHSTPCALTHSHSGGVAVSLNGCALFGLGSNNAVIDIVSPDLVALTPISVSVYRSGVAAAYVGNYALFAGGKAGSALSATVDVITSELVVSTAAALRKARASLTGATAGKGAYAIFAGGYNAAQFNADHEYYNTVDAFSSSLVRSSPANLSVARKSCAGASAGDYALIAGGDAGSENENSTVDAYSAALVKTSCSSLTVAPSTQPCRGGSLGNFALFSVVANRPPDAYDDHLTKVTIESTPGSFAHKGDALAAAGDYLYMAGGVSSSGSGVPATTKVSVFTY